MLPDGMFSGLVMGHLVGDYLFQNEWMALNKSRGGNEIPGLVHALVYTAAVCLFTADIRAFWVLVVFLSHWPVDRWSLAERWLALIHGRTLEGFMQRGHLDIPYRQYDHLVEGPQNYRILRGGFHGLVYAVTGNTIHLLLMIGGWNLLRLLGV